ncbi:hypothetical protein RO3G_05135 [Rhizopus delemar RA 99-880]|uniref:Uncharacterized protein n=1 Tax=Rhizopus delemar (strain RA 99-880 / ATCC MYA-4621 / FGSC 9543 / NRRL 43880) TaxID=246409 RepID=I1BW50_RHIO9|nr:hypothetical protein RO3G_05135 [Rhizopus delemar RA 99-880]|eukprot:EIE80430.1 hypothetical protein RO3G_05135 [Rhizopus delemar RA 99-880]
MCDLNLRSFLIKHNIVVLNKDKRLKISYIATNSRAISVYAVVSFSVRVPSVHTTHIVPVKIGKKRKVDKGKTQQPKPKEQ